MGSVDSLVLFGASGHSLGICSQVENGYSVSPLYRIVAFIDDYEGDKGNTLDGRPIISFDRWLIEYKKLPIVVGLGDPSAKRKIVERIHANNGKFGSIFYQERSISPDLVIGEGCIFLVPGFISTNCRIGNHVQIMPLVSIGHDVTIGNYTTLCPSVTVSGYVAIGEGCFVGAGASIVNGSEADPLIIGDGALIGIGAVVTKSVATGQRVFGNPARPIRSRAKPT